jgi:hypothetical protein
MWFCNAVCKWSNPSPELQDMFGKVRVSFVSLSCRFCSSGSVGITYQILVGFKQMLGEEAWHNETKDYPPVLLNRLKERYHV